MYIKQNGFYTYDEMIDSINALKEEYPSLIELSSIGKSAEGRDLPLLIVTSANKPHNQKPAYYIQANVHSNEAEGTTVSLYMINELCSGIQYKKLLEELAFYIVPRVNPDGAELALMKRYVPRSRNKIHKVKNHIIPQDINDDGMILNMRIQCDDGNMKPCKYDPRHLVARNPEDKDGPFYKVYTEGLIYDWSGGEFYKEKVTVVDFNRNYPVNWQPSNPVSGDYPFSEPETRAVGNFLLSKPNIFAGMDLHNGSNAVFRPGCLPQDRYDEADKKLMDKLGKMCSEITDFPYLLCGYRYDTDLEIPGYSGTSNDFAYFMLGISFFILELGNGFTQMGHKTIDMVMSKDFYKNNDKYVCELLKFHDRQNTEFFFPWTQFEHPQLGNVEIGGISTAYAYGISFPNILNIAPKVTRCLIEHAKAGPRFVFENLIAERLEGNLVKVYGNLVNKGQMPANVMLAGKGRPVRSPINIKCELQNGAKYIGGMKPQIYKEDLKQDEAFYIEWFVLAPEGSDIIVEALHPRAVPVIQNLKA